MNWKFENLVKHETNLNDTVSKLSVVALSESNNHHT